ncbi:jg911 [Pararge aegeria aegeria]|uniref:Jg911 protein n=1 Tax=Pararge aegeria aegeria TaxID=348720 RepID=A0A8S4QNM1_9NEOP|nr:jg911 [Pararge aegeria aegeria]
MVTVNVKCQLSNASQLSMLLKFRHLHWLHWKGKEKEKWQNGVEVVKKVHEKKFAIGSEAAWSTRSGSGSRPALRPRADSVDVAAPAAMAAGGEFVEGWVVAQVLGEGAYGEFAKSAHCTQCHVHCKIHKVFVSTYYNIS